MLWTRGWAHSIRTAILHNICPTHICGPPPLTLVQEKGLSRAFEIPNRPINIIFEHLFGGVVYSLVPTIIR